MENQKTVLITGVSGGIGQGLAKKFKEADYNVVGIDITSVESPFIDCFILLDLNLYASDSIYRDKKGKLLHDKIPRLNTLINNAAVQLLGSVEDININDWQKTMNVNLTSPLLLSQLFLSKLEDSKGSIINIGSIHQQLTKKSFVSYATSKSALIGLTKALAVDLENKVRVNAISPAAIETDMLRAGFNNDESAIDELRKIHPVKKIGKQKDVANLALFLSTENNGFIHGANFTLDGGISSVLKDL